jgi:hypothetical protein
MKLTENDPDAAFVQRYLAEEDQRTNVSSMNFTEKDLHEDIIRRQGFKLTEKELDQAILRDWEERNTLRLYDATDPSIEPWHLPHMQGCAGPCDQGRKPCTCGASTLDWADIPSPWRWRIVAAVSAMLVVTIAAAFAGWPA